VWPLRPADEAAVAALAETARLKPAVARVLWLRGVRDAAAVERWLRPSLDNLYPPELLPDFGAAVESILSAADRGRPILVWGHDDLDGMTATAILVRLLRHLRADVRYHIPVKGRERHGLNSEFARQKLAGSSGLVITVDCGITNTGEIDKLSAAGIPTVVTDHHEVVGELPRAAANVDAKRVDSRYPYRGLSAAGIALKLGMGLVRARVGLTPRQLVSTLPELVALAVLGTVADRVPLTGENRQLVAGGLPLLEECRLPAVAAVLARLRGEDGRLTVARFVAELLPLFAAANGSEGVERLLSSGPAEAQAWVEDLVRRRKEWRAEVDRSYETVERVMSVGDGVVFARSRDLSLRALGSCASRLKDRLQMPAIVMGWRGDAWVGEGRGMDTASLIELFKAHAGCFIDFGGHRKAGGFSIADGRVEEFVASAERYAHEHFAGRIKREDLREAEAVLPLRELDAEVQRLGPFGDGNPQPVFLSGPIELRQQGHLRYAAERPDLELRADRPGVILEPGVPLELVYSVDELGRVSVLDARAG
jgi:single-stranded-DNA-specific exonuclease